MADDGKKVRSLIKPESEVPDVDVPGDKMQEWIDKVCDGIKTLLTLRQQHYGNTIGEPCRIHSPAGPRERVSVYIDQKAARTQKGEGITIADSEADEIGFLILKRALMYGQKYAFNDPLDMYIKYNETGDEKYLEPACRFAHDQVES